jgi:ectoine hydroxylase-related dioxygenase (phytanoyl-CoA dioxygenase family)
MPLYSPALALLFLGVPTAAYPTGAAGLARSPTERAASLRVDVDHFKRHGFAVIPDVFDADEIGAFRAAILRQLGSGLLPHTAAHPAGNATAAFASGAAATSIADFASLRGFELVTSLIVDPRIHAVLAQVFGGAEAYRFCSHNGIGINRAVGWHKDWLNNQYASYQRLPLFADATGDGGHFIVKVAIYLQDHSQNREALTLIPGSHTDPVVRPTDATATVLHPARGALVVFNQLVTHRGRQPGGARAAAAESMRVLVSLGFGKRNNYTDEFEAGTVRRQADQLRSGQKRMRLRLRHAAQPALDPGAEGGAGAGAGGAGLRHAGPGRSEFRGRHPHV